jgi:hypothetical protein
MREPVTNKRMLKVMSGCLFIGGLAAIIGIYRAAKSTESPAYDV